MAIEKQKSLSLSFSFSKRNPFSCAFTLYACNKDEFKGADEKEDEGEEPQAGHERGQGRRDAHAAAFNGGDRAR